jgi:hypothetical protein
MGRPRHLKKDFPQRVAIRPMDIFGTAIKQMLSMHRFFLLLIMLTWSFSNALAQEPPRQNPQSEQQNNPNERGTEQSPFIIKIIPTENGQSKSGVAAYDIWFLNLPTADRIAIVTVLVGFIQFVALILTFWVMRRTAKRQLRAYVSVETRGINRYGNEERILGHIGILNNG